MRWDRADIGKTLARLGIEPRKRGKEWYALCPNPGHPDRKPSWRMRDEPGTDRHGKHNCFACGYKGTLLGFVMERLVTDFAGANAWFEGEGLQGSDAPVPSEVLIRMRPLRPKFRLPAGVVFRPWPRWVSAARDYAASRGITPEQVERWGIGYAVDGRLEGRIVFPYRDATGEPQGYTARTFTGHRVRYKEPDPSERPRLGAMFGEQHWPDRTERKQHTIYVVEGAINGLAVERALGHVSLGAIAGSSANAFHATKLSGFGRVVLVTDPDAAGDKAAAQLESMCARYTTLVRVRLANGDAQETPVEELRECLSMGMPPC